MFVINETMDFSSIIFKRDNGFCAKRWYFFELIAKRFDAFIRHSRVVQRNSRQVGASCKKRSHSHHVFFSFTDLQFSDPVEENLGKSSDRTGLLTSTSLDSQWVSVWIWHTFWRVHSVTFFICRNFKWLFFWGLFKTRTLFIFWVILGTKHFCPMGLLWHFQWPHF